MDGSVAEALSAGALFELLEGDPLDLGGGRLLEQSGGSLWDSDGNGRVAIIRPCMSRGKKVRGLQPIYTPAMLEDHADVFSGWPMYLDHMAEEALAELGGYLEEAGLHQLHDRLQEARSVKELGGRIIRSKWDPSVSFPNDEEFGYQQGAVVGVYRPQPRVREMLEADPEILSCSINAWPTAARPGEAPWGNRKRGMIIEGIRRKPMGSVDWVFAPGAGGRPMLLEDRGRAVSLLAEAYDAAQMKWSPDTTLDQLKEQLRSEGAGHLVPHLVETPAKGNASGGVTEERVAELIREANAELVESLGEKLQEGQEAAEAKAEEIAEQLREGERLERLAHSQISTAVDNGLPKRWGAELKQRWSAGTPAIGSIREGEDDDGNPLSAEQVLEAAINDDLLHSVELIREAGGQAVVKGLGATSADPGGEPSGDEQPPNPAFREFMRESGDLLGEDGQPLKPEDEAAKLAEMVSD